MNKFMVYLIVFFIGFIMLSSTIVAFLPKADAQIPTQQYVQRLEQEGKNNCEVFQINEFFYKPIRINMVHDRVKDHNVSIRSSDPASEVFWEGSFQTFQMVTDSTDRFDVEVILDYEQKHEEPRQIYYQIYAQDNVLMMEGNWSHEGFTFCKVFSFFANEQPYVPTFDDIQEQNNKFNADFRKEVASSNTSMQNGMITVSVVVLIVGIFTGLVFFLIIVSLKSMGRIGQKPVKKLDEMIGLVRSVSENLKLVSDHLLRTNANVKTEIVGEINNVLHDLSIVVSGLQRDLVKSGHLKELTEIKEPQTEVSKSSPATSETKVKTVEESLENIEETIKEQTKDTTKPVEALTEAKPNTPEEEKDNEDSMAELYGVSNEIKPDEVTFVPSDLDEVEEDIDKPSNPEEPIVEDFKGKTEEVTIDVDEPEDKISDKPIKKEKVEVDTIKESKSKEEVEEEEKIISIDNAEIHPCATCGAKPDAICGQCNKQFCDKHTDHECIPKKEDTDPVMDIAKQGAGFMKKHILSDKKKPNILDDGEVERRLSIGEDEADIEDEIADEYFKTPRNDNLVTYGDLQKAERKNRNKANSIRVGAMLRTLNKQVIN